MLERLREEIENIRKEGKSPKGSGRLVEFLAINFDVLLEGCQRYLRLFNDLAQNYTRHLQGKTINAEKSLEHLTKIQEQNVTENRGRLEFIVKKVGYFVMVKLLLQCKEIAAGLGGVKFNTCQIGYSGETGSELKKKETIIEELQRRYTDAKNMNKAIMKVIERHGLGKELGIVTQNGKSVYNMRKSKYDASQLLHVQYIDRYMDLGIQTSYLVSTYFKVPVFAQGYFATASSFSSSAGKIFDFAVS
eukprot:TRINITY_DN3102_c0_g1_i1.p6 TRINITY_DN3102_c0_g1~~TRINITY_DN3102_c0_g1_i1.p6  ORF type:complete len:247 (+),score=31.40 TRINITY_DN3102_c0_g1_i1:2064-2804(+)